jgi:hypothetical protein
VAFRLGFWGCICDCFLEGRQWARFLDGVLSLKAVGGAEKEQKLSSNSELLVSFVCGRVQNVANFGNGPHGSGRLSDVWPCEVW